MGFARAGEVGTTNRLGKAVEDRIEGISLA
jgi:hypothetical protein